MTPDDVQSLPHGLFLLNEGDDARSVAERVYTDPNASGRLLAANSGSWANVERVVVPQRPGRTTVVLEGDTPASLIRRCYPNQPESIFIAKFFRWNGGKDYKLIVGDEVFIPER